MTSLAAQQAQTNAELASGSSDLRKGTCTAIDWVAGLASVSIPGGTLQLPMVGVPPIINERCWIALFGNASVVLGPVTRPPYGTVNGVPAGGLVSVLCDDNVSRTVAYSDATGLTVSTRVAIDWTGGGRVDGTPLADPNTGAPIALPPAAPTGGGQKQRTFNPYASGTWRDGAFASGWVGGDVWDSDHNRGAYFYQGIADTIPDDAVIIAMSVFIAPGAGYGGNPSIGGHSLAGLSGALAITGRRVIPSSGGWIDITDLGNSFKTGALLGIGTGGGGNWHFPAAGQNNSGAISATWRT